MSSQAEIASLRSMGDIVAKARVRLDELTTTTIGIGKLAQDFADKALVEELRSTAKTLQEWG